MLRACEARSVFQHRPVLKRPLAPSTGDPTLPDEVHTRHSNILWGCATPMTPAGAEAQTSALR